jgi:hypothetical protein
VKGFDITPFITGILSLIGLFITSWLIPMLKSKTTLAQQEIIRASANIVVYAAEQLFGTKKGEEKLAYATERLKERLSKAGIYLDNSAIRPYIEAAVQSLRFKQETTISTFIESELDESNHEEQ